MPRYKAREACADLGGSRLELEPGLAQPCVAPGIGQGRRIRLDPRRMPFTMGGAGCAADLEDVGEIRLEVDAQSEFSRPDVEIAQGQPLEDPAVPQEPRPTDVQQVLRDRLVGPGQLGIGQVAQQNRCLLYTSPSPRDS